MARRKTSLFSLSFLDLLTSALGAVIFLFVITPKGGTQAAKVSQAIVYIDTAQMKIFGSLHDSLQHKTIGDTLFTVLVDYKKMPGDKKKSRETILASNEKREERVPRSKKTTATVKQVEKEAKQLPKEEKEPTVVTTSQNKSTYKGDAPSIPSLLTIEISWANKEENVDLFVCKGSSCVYGARKKDKQIGYWDSGKSRNRLFGNDLRTNLEAVRQFDEIIPGQYKIYAQFKESAKNKKAVTVNGLIYTKDKLNKERGETFSRELKIGKDRVLLGTLSLYANGNYKFKKQ